MFPLLARGGNGREFVGRARVWFCNTNGGEMGGMWKAEGKWEEAFLYGSREAGHGLS